MLDRPHQLSTREALAEAAGQGYQDGSTMLAPAGQVAAYGDGVAVEMQGVVEGQPARAYGIGLVSPHGGGATVVVAVAPAQWTAEVAQLVESVAESFESFEGPAPPAVSAAPLVGDGTDWTVKLSGRCVAYMSSSGSTGASFGGFSAGSYTSDRGKLYLYPDGTFESSASHSASFDTGGGFGDVAGGSGLQQGGGTVGSEGGATRNFQVPQMSSFARR